MNETTKRARNLRQNLTKQERILWSFLRKHQFFGHKSLRQYPIEPYIVDFLCREKKIIIEIDGGQHNQPEDIEYDKRRTKFLNSKGYRVLRFWNNDVDNNIKGVYKILLKEFRISEE